MAKLKQTSKRKFSKFTKILLVLCLFNIFPRVIIILLSITMAIIFLFNILSIVANHGNSSIHVFIPMFLILSTLIDTIFGIIISTLEKWLVVANVIQWSKDDNVYIDHIHHPCEMC